MRRIVRHAEYQTFINAALSCRLPHFFVPVIHEDSDSFAYGITITGKIAGAVRRNLLKRRIKAWFSSNADLLPTGTKVNLIARSGAAELQWNDLCLELIQLLQELRQLRPLG